jgi:hypothetical protein
MTDTFPRRSARVDMETDQFPEITKAFNKELLEGPYANIVQLKNILEMTPGQYTFQLTNDETTHPNENAFSEYVNYLETLRIKYLALVENVVMIRDRDNLSRPKSYGVLSSLSQSEISDQPTRGMPNKSIGETEYVRPEDRAALLSGYSMEEQMGLKLPDELAERLKNMNFDQAPSPISPEFAADIAKINSVQSQAILANLEVSGASDAGIGPRGTASFMDTPFDLPIIRQRQFAPVFDAAVSRRHIYKDLLNRMNKEIEQGPLKGIVLFTGVTAGLPNIAPGQFIFSIKWTHKARNRMKAYSTYFSNLKIKYLLEIKETDALKEHDILTKE